MQQAAQCNALSLELVGLPASVSRVALLYQYDSRGVGGFEPSCHGLGREDLFYALPVGTDHDAWFRWPSGTCFREAVLGLDTGEPAACEGGAANHGSRRFGRTDAAVTVLGRRHRDRPEQLLSLIARALPDCCTSADCCPDVAWLLAGLAGCLVARA